MVETTGRRFGESDAALVTRCCPGVFMDVAVLHQCAQQRWQKLLAVAGHRRNGATGDKVCGIFQNPGEFIDKLQQVAIQRCGGFFAIAQQENGNVLLALVELADQLPDVQVLVLLFHLIAEHQTINGFIGGEDCVTIVE